MLSTLNFDDRYVEAFNANRILDGTARRSEKNFMNKFITDSFAFTFFLRNEKPRLDLETYFHREEYRLIIRPRRISWRKRSASRE